MASSFIFSKILPSNSIVNPEVSSYDYLDSQSAFTFFDFLKHINVNSTPLQVNDLYIEYLKEWNNKKNSTISINDTIKTRYVELLKEITLKYTTTDEKRFLSNIDFNDPSELDIVIPFYSKKINEICDFYKEKRDRLKFKIEKNKIKGNSTSIEKAIYEKITDIVFSDVLEIGTYQNNIDYNTLLNELDIEIEELYDLYTNYLDNDPNSGYSNYDTNTELRKKLYSANINSIDANIFLNFDKAVANQIFEDVRVFLVEFGKLFTINYNISDVNLNCKPDDKLYNLVNSTKPKAQRLVELKNSLIKKYIGSDFYYITTGSTITDVTSGVLFKADNPSGNLLNRHFPTTATVEEESDLQSCRRVGLFFTPEKNSILYFSTPEKKYKIDQTKLEANKLYIFPDPELYGNTSGLRKTYDYEYPLIHIADYTKSIKNFSNGYVEGDIKSSPSSQDFYSYFSRSQTSDKKTGKSGLTTNFSSIYNKGIVSQWATDIYGNGFSLFKDKKRKNLIDNTTVIELTSNVCELYDGGSLTFYQNGLLPEVVLASNPEWAKPNIWASNYYYNLLIEGGIGKIVNGLMERGMFWEGYAVDGLSIDRNNLAEGIFDISLNQTLSSNYLTIDGYNYINVDPITFDLNINISEGMNNPSTYNIDGKFYVRETSNIYPKPLNTLDGNSLGNISEYNPSFGYNYILSSIKYKEFDAGKFDDNCDSLFDFETQTNHIIKEIETVSYTLTADKDNRKDINLFDIKNNYGTISVKDVTTGNIYPLSAALGDQLKSKYTQFSTELYTKVVDFNIYNDFIWIRTNNHLVFEKLTYSGGKYVYSGTTENAINYNNGKHTYNISNPFIFENRDYSMFVGLSVFNEMSNGFSIIPSFYKVDYKTCKITKISNTVSVSSDLYKNDKTINPIKVRKVYKPILTYNTRNNKYAIIGTIEDTNEMVFVYKLVFDYDGSIIKNQMPKLYAYLGGQKIQTLNFYDTPSFSGLLTNNMTNATFKQQTGELFLS